MMLIHSFMSLLGITYITITILSKTTECPEKNQTATRNVLYSAAIVQVILICTQLMISSLQKLGIIRAFGCPPFVTARATHALKPSVPGRAIWTTGAVKAARSWLYKCLCSRILQGEVLERENVAKY